MTFNQESPDSLIALMGDATGHGMKAGTMVTASEKSYFKTYVIHQILRI